MAKEINARLMDLLPDNMFFCAVIAHLNKTGIELTL
jgi:hypothetical protein